MRAQGWANVGVGWSSNLASLLRYAAQFVVLWCAMLSVAWADNIWEFVDGDGVVHMGNGAPPASRDFIWLRRTPSAKTGRGKNEGATSALLFPGYGAAKPHLEAAALSQSLEPALVIAVAAAESAFNAGAISRKGALGLMQVMPATATRYAHPMENGAQAIMDPKVNAQIGTRYLADLLRMFDGDKELALAAYNAGEGAVMKYGRKIPPYPETQQYVAKVMRLYRALLH